ncbi:hypothetical protein M407DRAFT_245134 [Tulasnella calospora MUT 4182]|uniref:Uncharacterized protein n=1 Tax=Tulasnella calospora MUT 4182 TaxID=1051891 RepID=A0A0C3QCV7_9AGAM|nr:hypothetical protein M407DRAFT_245134 [Tulasnella calospora MUT 4182]
MAMARLEVPECERRLRKRVHGAQRPAGEVWSTVNESVDEYKRWCSASIGRSSGAAP